MTSTIFALKRVSISNADSVFVGGDPELVRASQAARFASVEAVDEIIKIDAETKKGKLECPI